MQEQLDKIIISPEAKKVRQVQESFSSNDQITHCYQLNWTIIVSENLSLYLNFNLFIPDHIYPNVFL